MNWLTRIFKQILNPRLDLKGLPGSTSESESLGEVPAIKRGHLRWQDILLNFPLMPKFLAV